MAEWIKDIKVVGFDLDQTLYPKLKEIDEAIQTYIYDRIVEHKGCTREQAKELFCTYYPELSGSKTLEKLGIPNPRDTVQEALENADIDEYLNPDPELISVLTELKEKYGALTLITGSFEKIAFKKLEKLQIPLDLFEFVRTGEIPKSDGTAYRDWLDFYMKKDPSLKPRNFLYVGDRKSTDVDTPGELGIKAVLVNVKEKDGSVDVPQFGSTAEIKSLLL